LPLTLYMGKNSDDIMFNEAFNQLHNMLFEPLYSKTRYRSRNSSKLIQQYSSAILEEVKKKIPKVKGGNLIISNETILGYGNYNAELNVLLLRRVADQLKEKLSSDFDVSLKLVIVFREQVSFLQSHFAYGYAHYVDQFKTIEKFIDHGSINHHEGVWGALWFDEVLCLLESFFSEDEVIFIPYELLNVDPANFLERILVDTDLVGREHISDLRDKPKENVNHVVDSSHMLRDLSLIDRSINKILIHSSAYRRHVPESMRLRLRRIIERIQTRKVVIRGRVKIDPIRRAAIRELYRQSNSRTAERLGIDLASLEFATEKTP